MLSWDDVTDCTGDRLCVTEQGNKTSAKMEEMLEIVLAQKPVTRRSPLERCMWLALRCRRGMSLVMQRQRRWGSQHLRWETGPSS